MSLPLGIHSRLMGGITVVSRKDLAPLWCIKVTLWSFSYLENVYNLLTCNKENGNPASDTA